MPRKRSNASTLLSQATEVAAAIHEQDTVVAEKNDHDTIPVSLVSLHKIKDRPTNTRELDPKHVADLAESIGGLGLLEPLILDSRYQLLGGGHRLAAIRLLQDQNPETYVQQFPDQGIPCRIMNFNAEIDAERALQVELAENEKRKNYSRDQILRLADRLRALNYKETKGRPAKGEKALGPALAVAIGVSDRYVRKVLKQENEPDPKNRNSDPIYEKQNKVRLLVKTLRVVEELLIDTEVKQEQALAKVIPSTIKKAEAALKELKKQIVLLEQTSLDE